ncbi:MAG: protein kinase domain-containing protein [Planctomycetota bacterium]|jgi:serine/threonine protein kinase/formylglycine-generating enzyme required for sulfatase activity
MQKESEPTPPSGSSGSSGSPPEDVPEKLRDFAHFTIIKELGRGAQGIVYLAEDKNLPRKVALKMLAGSAAQSQAVRDRFQREAEITSKLEHPGICGVYEVGEFEEVPYIAMQYVRGVPLADIVEQSKISLGASRTGVPSADDAGLDDAVTQPGGDGAAAASDIVGPGGDRDDTPDLTEGSSVSIDVAGRAGDIQDLLRLIEKAARALHVAHEAGLVHRDIKPGNIMVTPEGEPVLLDFGLARDLGAEAATLTQSGQILGTPGYLAPEQIIANREKIDRRTDIYAMGVTLFECVTLARPFTADTWDQLFHKILNGAPRNPRKINPRIPPDLRTVLEVAMEREPKRRYQTAAALAEDLRRVRAFEPILAKAAGPILRLRKWSQRHPALAVASAAMLLFLMVFGGWWVSEELAFRADVREARTQLNAGNFAGALAAVARAEARAPSSAAAELLMRDIKEAQAQANLESQKKQSLDEAAKAREEAEEKQQLYAEAQAEIAKEEKTFLRDKAKVFSDYATADERAAFARKEQRLKELRLASERHVREAEEALNLAERRETPWGGTSVETNAAFASFFFKRWQEALAKRDAPKVALFRSLVEEHDKDGRHQAALLGRGTLALTTDPPDAEVYLFRYEPYETLRKGAIPRLVPVPTTGIGRARESAWHEGFYPGDPCLVITKVTPGSPAARQGLVPGDLIIRLNSAPCGNGLFVTAAAENKPLFKAGARPLARVHKLNGVAVEGDLDWATIAAAEDKKDRVLVLGAKADVACDRRAVELVPPTELVECGAKADLELLCLRGGKAVTLVVPAGQAPGLRCEETAYPLVCADANRVAAGKAIEADPGSYLLLVRGEGFADQRYPMVVPRGGKAKGSLSLQPAGSIPAGFVFIPPGAFVYGGDPAATNPRPKRNVKLEGFCIGRKEVSTKEWFEFVNDPRTLEKIAKAGKPVYLPRDDDGPLHKELEGGKGYTWHDNFEGFQTTPNTPALGISWDDIHGYLEWRNKKAEADGEPWVYDLPTQQEWEKAARGVDARFFPWGNRFDPSLAVTAKRGRRPLYDYRGGFEPRDESPFGVLDMGGHRGEWTKDRARVPGGNRAVRAYYRRGGTFLHQREVAFRLASRGYIHATKAYGLNGFRLVARPRR